MQGPDRVWWWKNDGPQEWTQGFEGFPHFLASDDPARKGYTRKHLAGAAAEEPLDKVDQRAVAALVLEDLDEDDMADLAALDDDLEELTELTEDAANTEAIREPVRAKQRIYFD